MTKEQDTKRRIMGEKIVLQRWFWSVHLQKIIFWNLVRGFGKEPWWFWLVETLSVLVHFDVLWFLELSIVDLISLLFDTFAIDQPTDHFGDMSPKKTFLFQLRSIFSNIWRRAVVTTWWWEEQVAITVIVQLRQRRLCRSFWNRCHTHNCKKGKDTVKFAIYLQILSIVCPQKTTKFTICHPKSWHKWISEYIRIQKNDTNKYTNNYSDQKYLNIRIYSSHFGLDWHQFCAFTI